MARLLARALVGTDLSASSQGGHRDCLFEGETGRFRTRPDLIIRRGRRTALIIDTKWKRMTEFDDPKLGVSQADVYQVMAYARLYECPHVVLLYPHHGGLSPDPIRRRYSVAKPDAQESLFVATLDITGSHRKHETALEGLIKDCLNSDTAA